MARLAMLIDLTRCIGCDACTVACKQENGTPEDVFFARVLNVEAGSYPNVKRLYIPVLCNHCENPACLKACPNKAIFKREDGIVLIDQDRCRGTGACVSACPYGNIILKSEDHWYLPEDRRYERDFVKPRLKSGVARKCTLCAQRVDRGLEPACVVACPTMARIFGDTEDPQSKISLYVDEQRELTGRGPFRLVPEAGTEPANMYLGTMAVQESSTLESPLPVGERLPRTSAAATDLEDKTRSGGLAGAVRTIALLVAMLLATTAPAAAQKAAPYPQPDMDVWMSSSCAGCHGQTAMGSFGPPLAETKLTEAEFLSIVRKGKSMMPAIPPSESPDAEVAALYQFSRAMKLDPTQIPISYKVARLLTARNLGIFFSLVTLVALLLSLRVLAYWVRCAGWKELKPAVGRFGYVRAAGVVLRSLIVDGLLVSSVWKKDRFLWLMHGLLLYGFLAIGLADILLSIFNPTRAGLPLTHPLKLLPNIGGLLVLAGIVYVRIRYRKDAYVDNGLTLGRDYLFLNLLTLTILSGFVVEIFSRGGAAEWVMPVYILHLAVIATLMVSAPFTRFQHAFVVPVMVAMTKLTAEIAVSGVEPGFLNEPSPGRDHKSRRIAQGVLANVAPEHQDHFRLRYYP